MRLFLFNQAAPTLVAPQEIHVLPPQGFIWLDCTIDELSQALNKIQELTGFTLHEQHVNDCLNPNHPCFYDGMQDYDLLVFRNLTYPSETGRIDTHSVSFVVFEKILLSVSNHDSAVDRVANRLTESGRRQPNQAIGLLLQILNAIVDNFLALRNPLTERFNRWQSRLLDEKYSFTQWKGLLDFKSDLRQINMICEEQQDTLGDWRDSMVEAELNQNVSVRLNDLNDHISRVLHHSQALEQELETLIELHYSILGKRTNEVMRLLTVISAIFLPLTLITNIFGMNFENIIGLHDPLAFYFTLGIMFCLAMILLLIFKSKRWI